MLQTIFLDSATGFEAKLKRFARARHEMYETFGHILRARDSIAGQIGEYFAVKRFNSRFREQPLVRVRSNFRDLDAIQTRSGKRYAVKTVTSAVSKTSNIWTPLDELSDLIDGFLILDLDPNELTPRNLFRLPVRKAERFWSFDGYQKAGKLTVDDRFRAEAETI